MAVSAEFRASGARGRARHRSTPRNPRNSGSGRAEFTFDTDQGMVCYEIEVEGIAEPVEPAPGWGRPTSHFLATGGIAVDLEADFQPDQSDEFKASGCVEVDSALLQAILENPDQFYVNIHNVEFPGGALSRLLG